MRHSNWVQVKFEEEGKKRGMSGRYLCLIQQIKSDKLCASDFGHD